LRDFPYYQNYVDLTRMELAAIEAVSPFGAPERIAFIGSGPLPLTSLCMYESLERNRSKRLEEAVPLAQTMIINIDHDPKALSQSAALCGKLGQHAQGLEFICQEGESLKLDLSDCDMVFLAALVGATQEEKEAVLISVVEKMPAGSVVVIRTAHSLRKLLYPVGSSHYKWIGFGRVSRISRLVADELGRSLILLPRKFWLAWRSVWLSTLTMRW
jgi:nicotianamine synthase